MTVCFMIICHTKKLFSLQESSRSHAVFTIIIEHGKDDSCGGMVVTIGKLRLVDLAGSERYSGC